MLPGNGGVIEDQIVPLGPSDAEVRSEVEHLGDSEVDVMDLHRLHGSANYSDLGSETPQRSETASPGGGQTSGLLLVRAGSFRKTLEPKRWVIL
jgi:hypothetical protein